MIFRGLAQTHGVAPSSARLMQVALITRYLYEANGIAQDLIKSDGNGEPSHPSSGRFGRLY